MKKSMIYGLLVDGILIGFNIFALAMDFGQKIFEFRFFCHLGCFLVFAVSAILQVRNLIKYIDK